MLLALTLCACVALPTSGENTRARSYLDERAAAQFLPEVSTREDVLLALGEPGDVAEDGSWFSYVSLYNEGGWFLLVLPDPRFGLLLGEALGLSADHIRYQALRVFFDRAGRARELLSDSGTCNAPCLELYRGPSPESLLVYARTLSLVERNEMISERFIAAAWRSGDSWIPGAVVVTDRALAFLELGETGPLYRQFRRFPMVEIASVGWESGDEPLGGQPTARVTRADGTREIFAFKHLPTQAPHDAPPFDRERTKRFIDTLRFALSQSLR